MLGHSRMSTGGVPDEDNRDTECLRDDHRWNVGWWWWPCWHVDTCARLYIYSWRL